MGPAFDSRLTHFAPRALTSRLVLCLFWRNGLLSIMRPGDRWIHWVCPSFGVSSWVSVEVTKSGFIKAGGGGLEG
ncbi:hypothetical protein B0I37DRAFT_375661 [Chaetomium sp. MPI-CAGE-AT-0009]|nr:hypothetical protein B0I37DRAFT_375661 [Chaetomium sp. MPI-CAGE-AT-0009]